jgi:hypothetical protein
MSSLCSTPASLACNCDRQASATRRNASTGCSEGGQGDGFGLHCLGPPALEQHVAAFGLAGRHGAQVRVVAQLAGQAEQRVGWALLQFQFHLQQRQTARAVAGGGVDVAAVQGHLDLRLAMGDQPPPAREIGGENGNQLASQRLQFVGQRRVIDQRHEVEGTGRRRRFPFAAPGQAADHRAPPFFTVSRVWRPHTAFPHRDSPREQGALGRVEVGVDQPLPFRGFGPPAADAPAAPARPVRQLPVSVRFQRPWPVGGAKEAPSLPASCVRRYRKARQAPNCQNMNRNGFISASIGNFQLSITE